MSTEFTLKAEPRNRVGKGSSRALRRKGQIPAVIYGEKQAPLAVALPFKPVYLQIYAGGFMTKVMVIEHGAEKIRVLPRDYQLDPVKDMPLHVDFLRISEKSRVTVEVPVHFVNQENSVGLKQGGVLNIIRHVVELDVPASSIPESIIVDIAEADIGDSIHISAAKIPAGAELVIQDRDFTLATISAPADEEEETAEPAAAAAAPAPAAAATAEVKKPEAKKAEPKKAEPKKD